MDRAIEAADRSWFEIKDEWDPANFPQSTVSPAIIAAFKAESRRLTLTRCLRILIALEEQRANIEIQANAVPQSGLPAEAITDPFSGEPFRLRRAEKGWVIYSVMENQKDDGGDFTDSKDYGLAPPGYQVNPSP